MSNSLQYSDPDTMISQIGKNASGVYLIDPTTQKAVSPTSSSSSVADTVATGSLTAAQATVGTPVAGGTVSITLGNGQAVVEVQLTGTFNAGTTVIFEGTEDSGVTTNWFSTFGQDTSGANPLNISSIVGGASKLIRIPAMGYTQIRVRANPFAGGDSVTVRMIASVAGTTAGSLSTNDGTFAKETGGNLATLAGVVSSSKAAVKAASGDFADGAINTLGLQADAAYTDGTGAASGTSQGIFKGLFVKLTAIATSVAGVLQVKRSTVAVYSLASTTSTGATQNSGDLTVGPYTEISIDINTTAQAGTSPTIQYFYERKAADGIYYILWQSAVLTAATNTLSTSIGAGMAYNQSLGVTGRLRWVVGGSATPTYTFSANIQGK